jgi:septum formation protein
VLYLASTSPRRARLLEEAGIRYELVAPGPEPRDAGGSPPERAVARAASKAAGAEIRSPTGLVLGVDTVVDLDGAELGKPTDRGDAVAMLRAIAGREHLVHTALCLRTADGRRDWRAVDTARVACDELDASAIDAYAASGEWRGKAGGYGLQGSAGRFLSVVAGAADTVVGLPVARLRELLDLAREEGEWRRR